MGIWNTLLCLYYESDTTSREYLEYVGIPCFACTMSQIGYNFLYISGIRGHTLLCLYYESDRIQLLIHIWNMWAYPALPVL